MLSVGSAASAVRRPARAAASERAPGRGPASEPAPAPGPAPTSGPGVLPGAPFRPNRLVPHPGVLLSAPSPRATRLRGPSLPRFGTSVLPSAPNRACRPRRPRPGVGGEPSGLCFGPFVLRARTSVTEEALRPALARQQVQLVLLSRTRATTRAANVAAPASVAAPDEQAAPASVAVPAPANGAAPANVATPATRATPAAQAAPASVAAPAPASVAAPAPANVAAPAPRATPAEPGRPSGAGLHAAGSIGTCGRATLESAT